MKTGHCPIAIDKSHAFVKASFPICMALPNSAHSRMGCLLQKRKRAPTLGARKKAKPEKPSGSRFLFYEIENYSEKLKGIKTNN